MLWFCFGVELYLVIFDKQPLCFYRCNIQSCGAAHDRSNVVLTKTVHWMGAVVSFCICGTLTFEQLLLLRADSTCAICCIWDIWGLDVLAVSPEETWIRVQRGFECWICLRYFLPWTPTVCSGSISPCISCISNLVNFSQYWVLVWYVGSWDLQVTVFH
jgi:hypothetical protein